MTIRSEQNEDFYRKAWIPKAQQLDIIFKALFCDFCEATTY